MQSSVSQKYCIVQNSDLEVIYHLIVSYFQNKKEQTSPDGSICKNILPLPTL